MAGPSSAMDTDENPARERDTEILKIIRIINIIIDELGGSKVASIRDNLQKWIIDIDLSDEISGFLMTVFTCLRKEENDKPGHMKFLDYTAKISVNKFQI